MSGLLHCNMLALTLMSIVLLSVFGQQKNPQDDGLCPFISSVLCVKDVLGNIRNALKEVNETACKIHQLLRHRGRFSFGLHTNRLKHQIYSNRPTSKYHEQFLVVNNMDKTDLIHLIQEENFAISYLYKSIKNLLPIESIWSPSIDTEFEKLSSLLQNRLLCNYRNILDVYSGTWLSINDINGIQPRNITSISHNTYSVVIIQLLRQWIQHIDIFVANVQSKLV